MPGQKNISPSFDRLNPFPFCFLHPRQLLHRLSGSLIQEHKESSSNRSLSSKENRSPSPSQSNIKSIVLSYSCHKDKTGRSRAPSETWGARESDTDSSLLMALSSLLGGFSERLRYLYTFLRSHCFGRIYKSTKFWIQMEQLESTCSTHNNNKSYRKCSESVGCHFRHTAFRKLQKQLDQFINNKSGRNYMSVFTAWQFSLSEIAINSESSPTITCTGICLNYAYKYAITNLLGIQVIVIEVNFHIHMYTHACYICNFILIYPSSFHLISPK